MLGLFFFSDDCLLCYYSLIMCVINFLSCGCEVACLTSFIQEVARTCPISRAGCSRGRSSCFFPSAPSVRWSSHAGAMQKDLLMQQSCTSCFSSGDGVCAWQTTLRLCISLIWHSPCWHPSWSWSNHREFWQCSVPEEIFHKDWMLKVGVQP